MITYEPTCPACGDLPDYCQGHGEIGDPDGCAILSAHDAGNHESCHPGAECVPARMVTYRTRLAGNLAARCPVCDAVCVYWDDEDLTEDGHLLCWHDTPNG